NDILEKSPFPKASTYRFLQTLTNQGMLSYNEETQKYHMGIRLVRLAHSAWKQASLAPIASSAIDKLSAQTGETIHLAQLDNGQVLYVDKRNAKSPINMFSDAGKIGPAYCTGVGKAMVAFLGEAQIEKIIAQQSFYAHTAQTLTTPEQLRQDLKEIRETGISFDREEHEPNIICIAVPILSDNGKVLGGMSITSSTTRMSLDQLAEYASDLKATAKEVAQLAANWQFPGS
ncbi:MAG: IclR family transcriptional regulator, partial [Alphaproteobacteria bacterium]|nr:IclR family transcriptional regulator [Alphaproteobacteria bacterium]